MRGDKIEYARKTLEFIINQLSDADRLSLITFNASAQIHIPLSNMTAEAKQHAKTIARNIQPSRGTYLVDALATGVGVLNKRSDQHIPDACVLLMTDGLVQKDLRTDQLVNDLHRYFTYKNVTVSTFGYGIHHDSELMAGIAKRGNGQYQYIQQPKDFQIAVNYTLHQVAFGVALRNPFIAISITHIVDGREENIVIWSGNIRNLCYGSNYDLYFDAKIPQIADIKPKSIVAVLIISDDQRFEQKRDFYSRERDEDIEVVAMRLYTKFEMILAKMHNCTTQEQREDRIKDIDKLSIGIELTDRAVQSHPKVKSCVEQLKYLKSHLQNITTDGQTRDFASLSRSNYSNTQRQYESLPPPPPYSSIDRSTYVHPHTSPAAMPAQQEEKRGGQVETDGACRLCSIQ